MQWAIGVEQKNLRMDLRSFFFIRKQRYEYSAQHTYRVSKLYKRFSIFEMMANVGMVEHPVKWSKHLIF